MQPPTSYDSAFEMGYAAYLRAHSALGATSLQAVPDSIPELFAEPYRNGWDSAARALAVRTKRRQQLAALFQLAAGVALLAAGVWLLRYSLLVAGELTYLAVCIVTAGLGLTGATCVRLVRGEVFS